MRNTSNEYRNWLYSEVIPTGYRIGSKLQWDCYAINVKRPYMTMIGYPTYSAPARHVIVYSRTQKGAMRQMRKQMRKDDRKFF